MKQLLNRRKMYSHLRIKMNNIRLMLLDHSLKQQRDAPFSKQSPYGACQNITLLENRKNAQSSRFRMPIICRIGERIHRKKCRFKLIFMDKLCIFPR